MFVSRTTIASVITVLLTACGPLEPSEFCGPAANSANEPAAQYGVKSVALGGGNGRLANKFYWPTSSLNVKQVDVRLKRKGALNGTILSLAIYDDIGDGTQPAATVQFSDIKTLNADESLGTNISTTDFEWVSFNPGCYADLEQHNAGVDPHLYWLILSGNYSSSDTNQIVWGGATNTTNPAAAFKEFNSVGWQLFDYPTNSGSQDFLFRFTCVDTSDPADAALTPCP